MTTTDAPTDIHAAIRQIVEDWLPEGDYVPAIEGAKLAAHLAETQPELLDDWLHARAGMFLAEVIRHAGASQRSTARSRAARAFSEREDDGTASGPFTVPYCVDDDNTQRRAGDMTGADWTFVAKCHESTSVTALMLAAFAHAVAKKIGHKRTSDVMTEEQFDQLYRDIVK